MLVSENYFQKMRGTGQAPPRINQSEIIWSWIGAFLGIALVGFLHQHWFQPTDLTLIIGSFGASAALIYGAPATPLAQPRNLMGGHIISALIGIACFQLLGTTPWLAEAMAVATAIVGMHVTRTLHPPGGATALIAVIGSDHIHQLGYWYAVVPAAGGATLMLLVAVLINNIPASRRYPLYWW